jgi:uncharacterized protein
MLSKPHMKDFVINFLRDNLSKKLYYHNPEHTLYVLEQAKKIGRHEGCTDEELEFIEAAALWHDTGYTKTYSNHEEESCLMALRYLPEYGYSSADINKVCGMIMATKIPQMPKNRLEEIISDADLEYLGTSTFKIKAESLFREMKFINPLLTVEKWRQAQISFLQKHRYFTRFCIENREPAKQLYLNKLVQGIR